MAKWIFGSLSLLVQSLLMLGVLIAPSELSAAPGNPRNHVNFYTETYGSLQPQADTRVALAHEVFKRVVQVADGSRRHQVRLAVVNSPADPWAISLPDNHIVLSKGAVDNCFKLAALAESCLAFILGHEIAHISNQDFWHQEVSRFLAEKSTTPASIRTSHLRQQQAKTELAADDKGFIYAAMAGYAVDQLLELDEQSSQDQDFFQYWSAQTSTALLSNESMLAVRANLLRQRLAEIEEKLTLFEYGVRLAHFDYCDDAISFFSEFLQTYPGREVLNNIGFCYLQVARQQMPPDRAYFYWMPLQLDAETRASALSQRGAEQRPKLRDIPVGEAEGVLLQAVNYLKQAIDNDPYYLPARINLAVAQLYLGQPHQARAILDEARAIAPKDSYVQTLEAISIYEQSDRQIDLLPNAIARLQDLAAQDGQPANTLFNLYRLRRIASPKGSLAELNKLLAQAGEKLPTPIQQVLCADANSKQQLCDASTALANEAEPYEWPLPSQGWTQVDQTLQQEYLTDWSQRELVFPQARLNGAIYQDPKQQKAVLQLDGFVQMQVVSEPNVPSVKELQQQCEQPLRTRTIGSGEIMSCQHWAALTRNQQTIELWWVAR